jgi:hypothetical protein
MPFNINNFKAKGLIEGGARPSQFEVDIFPFFQSSESTNIKLLVRASSLPPMIVDSVNVPYFGRNVKFAGDRTFPDWNVTVMNDENFHVRGIMEKWSNEINTLISNRMSQNAFATTYKTSAEVTQFGKNGAIIRKYRFVGLFPTQIDQISLDWDSASQIEYFDVNFAYDYWEPIDQGRSADKYNPILPDDGQGSDSSDGTSALNNLAIQ